MKKIIIILAILSLPMSIGTGIMTSIKLNAEPEVETISATVTATMYRAVSGQCDSDPDITAGLYKIKDRKNAGKYRWVALSRNLLKRWGGDFDYGDMIEVSNAGHKDGIYKVVDTMDKRFKDRMDFLENFHTELYKFEEVEIRKVEI